MLWNTSKLTTIAVNTSRHTSAMSNARSLAADPAGFTESKISNGTSLAVTRMPSFFVILEDVIPDSQEKIIVKDTCDSVITLRRRRRRAFIRHFRRWNRNTRRWSTQKPQPGTDDTMLLDCMRPCKNGEISAKDWTGRIYNSEHPHGSCGFSEPSMLFSITGVQPRKLRVKDGRNVNGKVGFIGCCFSSPL